MIQENEVNLENKIRETLPHLQKVEKGQRFLTSDGDIVTALEINIQEDFVSGYRNFDGLAKSWHLPKLKILGYSIKLNDVLSYLQFHGYGFETYQGKFVLKNWDLSEPLLKNQSEELIKFLNEL